MAAHQVETLGTSVRQRSVPVRIEAGFDGNRLVFVPVTIDGKGPYDFVLDTGASKSVIAVALLDELDLRFLSQENALIGVAGSALVNKWLIRTWSLGEIRLPAASVVAVDLPRYNGYIPMQGLLGADVLSQLGAVTLDFHQNRFVVQSAPPVGVARNDSFALISFEAQPARLD